MAKEGLIAALHPEVNRQLVYGTVTNEEGRRFRDVVTFRAKHQIVVRGDKHASYRYCPNCGDLCYFALGRSYLYPQPAPGVAVFGAGHDRLVIRSDYFSPKSLDGFTGIKIRELAFLQVPLDAPSGVLLVADADTGYPSGHHRIVFPTEIRKRG